MRGIFQIWIDPKEICYFVLLLCLFCVDVFSGLILWCKYECEFGSGCVGIKVEVRKFFFFTFEVS